MSHTNNASPSSISIDSHSILISPLERPAPRLGAACAAALTLALVLAACASIPKSAPTPASVCPVCPPPPEVAAQPAAKPISLRNNLLPASWDQVEGWTSDGVQEALPAFVRSCGALRGESWERACTQARSVDPSDATAARAFFQSAFAPYQVVNSDGSNDGLITGYYEPLLRGSRRPSTGYRFALYAPPEDLLIVDLGELYPELKPLRLRGRLEGRRVVPYYSRSEIQAGRAPLVGRELLYINDAVELFFLQIQGSGRVILDDGETVRVSYADQNGHPYRSVGRLLVERGELTAEQASMQGIKAWAQRNPERLAALLDENPSYVFFRELPATAEGPPGALNIPLTTERSVAVDPRAVPLGAPVFLSTTWPTASQPLQRLMIAQDTGGAIKGAVRADVYFGSGEEAGARAGKMRQRGRLWVLLPIGFAF
jgi:membrane-bound lytic murein transglycosylase A